MDPEWIEAWMQEALSEIALGRQPIGISVQVVQMDFGPYHYIWTHNLQPAQ